MSEAAKLGAGRRKVPPFTSSARSGALDELTWAVLNLCNAVTLVGHSLDEGPLRTAVLKSCAAAKAATSEARDAKTKADTHGKGHSVRGPEAGSGEVGMDGVKADADGDLAVGTWLDDV